MNKWGHLAGCVAVMACCVVGCSKSGDSGGSQPAAEGEGHEEHAEHPAPKSLPEALATIKEARTELGEAYVAGNTPEADHAWHELSATLGATKKLIASASMERYDSTDAQDACDKVSELVGELHPPHGADAKLDPAKYDKVKGDLDAAITKLEESINKGLGEDAAAE